jgi:DNA primase
MRATIDDIKARVNLEDIIAHTTGEQPRHNKVHCPFHADRNPSLAIYPDGRWHCFGCGLRGDVLDFLGYLHYGPGYDPAQHLRDVIDRIAGLDIQPRPARPARAVYKPTLDSAMVDAAIDRMGARERAYWLTRRIASETLRHFGVGWTGQRYTIPHYVRGLLMGIKLRRDDDVTPRLEPKYVMQPGSRIVAPYNIDVLDHLDGSAPLLIVEDEKSVWAAWQEDIAALAAPAHSWRDEWSAALSAVDRILIVADWDEPGLAGAARITKTIRRAVVAQAGAYYSDGSPATDLHDMYMAGVDLPAWVAQHVY